jgi:hypothetical protein
MALTLDCMRRRSADFVERNGVHRKSGQSNLVTQGLLQRTASKTPSSWGRVDQVLPGPRKLSLTRERSRLLDPIKLTRHRRLPRA